MRTNEYLRLCAASALALAVAGPSSADVVKLRSGASIAGKVLKQTDRLVWVDIGADVVQLAMEQVDSIQRDESGTALQVDTASQLFSTAKDLPTLPPKELAKTLGPAVIKVSSPGGLGSGVIISPDGFAITNAHVIQGERALRATIWVKQPDGSLKRTEIDDVEIEAVSNSLDLALIHIKSPDGKPFPVAPVEGEESIEAGQRVFAIGNPLGLERTLTEGVVSVPAMQLDGRTYIQTDTPINPGNSGGPLFNMRGEVVGITNMKITLGENVGFAIPARYVKDFVRHREAFAFDKNNPNSGHFYHPAPPRPMPGVPSELEDGSSKPAALPPRAKPTPGSDSPNK
jgi:serine protease Do